MPSCLSTPQNERQTPHQKRVDEKRQGHQCCNRVSRDVKKPILYTWQERTLTQHGDPILKPRALPTSLSRLHGSRHIDRRCNSNSTVKRCILCVRLSFSVAMNGRFDPGIALCIVHEHILVRLHVPHTHLHLAALCLGLLVLHGAHLVVGCGLVARVLVVDADEESGEGRETGANNTHCDFGVSSREDCSQYNCCDGRACREERTQAC